MPLICEMSVNSICAFKGQVIAGGFVAPWHDAGLGHVGWSKIGSATFELDAGGTSSYAPLPGGGVCEKVLPLRVGFVAYGSRSVTGYHPVAEPVATFGMGEILPALGVAGRDAAAGDWVKHFFITSRGELYSLSGEFQAQKIGFRDIFKPLLDANEKVFLSYCSDPDELYISFDSVGYVFKEGNLYERTRNPSNVNPLEGVLYASFDVLDPEGDDKFTLATSPLDNSVAGMKTLTSIELYGRLGTGMEGRVLWKNDRSEDTLVSPWRKFSPGGICNLFVTGRELIIEVRGTLIEKIALDSVGVKIKMSDKSNIRGPYAG